MGGTHNAVMSSAEYLSQAQRKFDNIEEGFYIAPAFLDKITIHVAKVGRAREGGGSVANRAQQSCSLLQSSPTN
jgi:hypothetical protein